MHKTCRQYKLCRRFTTSIYFKAQFNSCKHDSAVMLLGRLLQLSKKASFNWDLLMIHHSHTTLTCKFSITSGIFHIILITFMEDMVILGILNYFLVLRLISDLSYCMVYLSQSIIHWMMSFCAILQVIAFMLQLMHHLNILRLISLLRIYLTYIYITLPFFICIHVCVARKSFL